MATPNAPEPRPDRHPDPRSHWLRILFILPFIAMLWVSSYNSTTPGLFGFPYFYWYQLLWVLLSAAIAGLIYIVEHRSQP